MSLPTIGVILNPQAAGGRALKKIPEVTSTLTDLHIDFALHVTTAPLEAWEQARIFAEQGLDRVIVVGGDGTFNEVVNGLQEADRLIPFGVVPAGTGCDFPRTIGVPNAVDEAVARACFSDPIRIDLGWASCGNDHERFFLNVGGLGFDATIAERATRTKLPGGKLSYLSALAASLASYRNIEVDVDVDGASISTKAVFVTVANAKYFGGGFKITPMADISDGKLDFAIIGDIAMKELLRQIPNVYRGKHINHPHYTHQTASSVRIDSPDHALVQVDGELIGTAPVHFEIRPGVALLVS